MKQLQKLTPKLGLWSAILLLSCWGAAQDAQDSYDESRFQGLVAGQEELNTEGMRVLMFTKTAAFRHDVIPFSKQVVMTLSNTYGFEVDVTENAAVFSPEALSNYDVVMFASTTGEVLNAEQQTAFEDFITAGGGFVGVHAASDTLYDWPWYGELVGAYFDGHPQGTSIATLQNEAPDSTFTQHLGETFQLDDEWYFFNRNPQNDVSVLLRIDESSNELLTEFATERGEVGDHPMAWCHPYEGGRSWYTALGHREEVWSDVRFQEMLLEGMLWAAGRTEANCSASGSTQQ